MKNKLFQVVMLAVMALGIAGCGSSGGSAFTITVTDAAGVAVATTGTSNVYPNSFTLTFSEAMNDATVTTAGNITLACGALPPTIVTTGSGTAYTVTVTDGWRYAQMNCTLTLTANIQTAASQAITAAAYNFQNACAVSDDFNANSSNCWTVIDTTQTTTPAPISQGYANWEELLGATGILTFDTTDSALLFKPTTIPTDTLLFGAIYKQVTVNPNGFEILIKINPAGADISLFEFGLAQNHVLETFESSGKYLMVTWQNDTDPICGVMYSPTGLFADTIFAPKACPESTTHYIKVSNTKNGDTYTISAQYSADGVTFEEIPTHGGTPWPTDQNFSDTPNLVGFFITDQTDANSFTDEVKTTGLTSTTQY